MIDAAFDWGEPAFGAARVAEGQVVESAVERVAQALAGFELGQGWLEGSKLLRGFGVTAGVEFFQGAAQRRAAAEQQEQRGPNQSGARGHALWSVAAWASCARNELP